MKFFKYFLFISVNNDDIYANTNVSAIGKYWPIISAERYIGQALVMDSFWNVMNCYKNYYNLFWLYCEIV